MSHASAPAKGHDPRHAMLGWLSAGLRAVHGTALVANALADWRPDQQVRLVALGKAAGAMAQGAARALGERIAAGLVVSTQEGLGVGSGRSADIQYLSASHPVPDGSSLAAGKQLLEFVHAAPTDSRWLFLISGGASSLVEALPARVTLADLQRANAWLLASGWDIRQINALRQRLSCIKGGGLLSALKDRPVRVLYVADVPDNDPAMIGSGLLAPPLPAPDWAQVPLWLRRLCHQQQLAAVRESVDLTQEILADNRSLLAAVADAAQSAGLPVTVHRQRLDQDAASAGRLLAEKLLRASPGVQLWGGECTVELPNNPGSGGRCQHLALSAALVLSRHSAGYLLASGSDGRDGNTEVAGALVDGGTLERGEDAGIDATHALGQANSHTFLGASGDLVDTGPTGTNVNDVVIGFKH